MIDEGESFDWVEARAQCNIRDLFGRLRTVIESNVKSAARNNIAAEFKDESPDQFVVRLSCTSLDQQSDWRRFFLGGTDIQVFGVGHEPLLVGRASLHSRDCLIEVGEGASKRHLKLWEFGRLAIEPLFFRGRSSFTG